MGVRQRYLRVYDRVSHECEEQLNRTVSSWIQSENQEKARKCYFLHPAFYCSLVGRYVFHRLIINGKAEYKEGSLSGLSQVSRIGECQGPLNSSIGTTINCTLSFTNLKTSYKGKVKYGILPKVSIDAKAEVSSAIIVVGIVKTQYEAPKVKTFGIKQVGQLNTHFSGLGPLNKHMKVLEENYRNHVAGEVSNVIHNRFQYALNLAVAQVPMPLR
ncbi:hypothetical protein CDAR_470201 [Caerostris darwini]|uniref:Uncharacterized protein n=1 Tax=Caerostris darwini TaxID=1538125 RepID=A0AAV4PPM5_9ARAC|nr:hypothetical protein CDAR_470201 [Caerostris darwini]